MLARRCLNFLMTLIESVVALMACGPLSSASTQSKSQRECPTEQSEENMFKPVMVILHCTDSPDYTPDNKAFDLIGAEDINYWHTEGRKRQGKTPWRKIGYHGVTRQSGVWEVGRELDEQGAHCYGKNSISFGEVYVGKEDPNPEQIATLIERYKFYLNQYEITADQWFAHRDFDQHGKTCPGFSINLMREIFKRS